MLGYLVFEIPSSWTRSLGRPGTGSGTQAGSLSLLIDSEGAAVPVVTGSGYDDPIETPGLPVTGPVGYYRRGALIVGWRYLNFNLKLLLCVCVLQVLVVLLVVVTGRYCQCVTVRKPFKTSSFNLK